MSSISSFSSVNFNVNAINTNAMESAKTYLCPKCNRHYDLNLCSNLYVGRVPLILKCKHTMCEECVKLSFSKREIICSECQQSSLITENDKRKIQEIFPVNFYLLGIIYYSKPNMNEISKISLKPSGVSYRNKYKMELGSTSSLGSEPSDIWSKNSSKQNVIQEKCSQQQCKRPGILRCEDCVEIYCQPCCTTLHKAARGLQKHKITKISEDSALELTEKCAMHPDQILEFHCNNCNTVLCAYCILQSHQSHSYNQLTFLNDSDKPSFNDLLMKAETKLKRLMLAHKRVACELNRSSDSSRASSLDSSLSKYFANAHAKLQILENNLRNDVGKVKNSNTSNLNEIQTELLLNIQTLNRLVNIARRVDNPGSGPKLNIKTVTERLSNSLSLPCYLIGQQQNSENIGFVFKDVFANIEENFSISADNDGEGYHLVGEDELPEDFDTDIPLELLELDISECKVDEKQDRASSVSSYKSLKDLSPTEMLTNTLARPQKQEVPSTSNTLESWVKNSAQIAESSNFNNYVLENEAREYVLVTHIDSPELFYTQLVRFQSKLQNLEKQIEQYIRSFAPMVHNVELNKLYIVKYNVKSSYTGWCRGRIIDIILNDKGEQMYKVLFIDYGNSKVVGLNMLREISCGLAKPKPYALQCKLFNLYPINQDWNAKASKLMARILSGAQILMVVMNTSYGITEVDLVICNYFMSSIREALIFIGYAVPNIDVATPNYHLRAKTSLPKLHTKSTNFKKEQPLEVILSHVINPEKVYILEASCLHHIEQLSNSITKHYCKNYKNRNFYKKEQVYVPKQDMIVAARCSPTSWRRGRITRVIIGQGLVEVFLVDYGRTITISYKEIRILSERFCTLDCQAILVSLTDIKPADGQSWDPRASEILQKYVNTKEKLRAIVIEPQNPLKIALFECYASMDICINALLVQQDLAKSTGVNSTNLQWLKANDPLNTKQEPSFVVDLLNTIQCSNHEVEVDSDEDKENQTILKKQVRVLRAVNPELIYVRWDDEKTKQEQHQLQCALYDYYSVKRAKVALHQPGDACVVYNNKDKQYYRAIILHKIDDLNYKMMLRDIAEEMTVSKGNIYSLEPQFKQFHEGAIRCHLTGILPAGDKRKWSGLAVEFLEELFKNKSNLLMTKDGNIDTERKSVPVIMWYSECKPGEALEPSRTILYNINKLLIKQGLALKYRPKSIERNKSENTGKEEHDVFSSGGSSEKSSSPINQFNVTSQEIIPKKVEYTEIPPETFTEPSPDDQKKPGRIPKMVHKAPENLRKLFLTPHKAVSPTTLLISSATDANSENIEEHKERPKTFGTLFDLKAGIEPELNKLDVDTAETEMNKLNWYEMLEYEETLQEKEEKLVQEEALEQESLPIAVSTQVAEIVDWLPASPFTKHRFEAYATSVDYNAHIYLHDKELEPVLKEMEANMKVMFDNFPSEPLDTVWVPGQLCTVKYFVNESWYRGKVVNVGYDSIKVFMIDYGNEEDCKHEDLRSKVMYTDLPAFASKVQLYNVYPKKDSKWLTSDLDELHKKIVESVVHVTLKGNEKIGDNIPFAVIKLDDVNINHYMLEASKNLVASLSKIDNDSSSSDSDDVIVEAEISGDDASKFNDSHTTDESCSLPSTCSIIPHQYYHHTPLSINLIGQKIPVAIVSLRNYNEFVFEVQTDESISKTKELFDNISDEIKLTALNQSQLDNLEVGVACIGKFSEDGEWYRGEVFDLNIDNDTVGIWFVDFGNFEYVPKSDVRNINPDWLKLPVLQYLGEIDNIELSDESCLMAVFEDMSKYCGTLKIAEITSSDPVKMHLYNEDNQLAYQDLLKKGLLILKE